jgi:phage terminase large subunit
MIVRKTYPELQENHINPMISMLNCYHSKPSERIASYNDAKKNITFPNGSRILFRYCDTDKDAERFQGTEVDILFIDEATHQSEERYKKLSACVRGVNNFPKRIYLTCNPGGVGHQWVKRLFVDRDYYENENPDDYIFIQAKVTDNKALMENDPGYIKALEGLPEHLRSAWLDGNWDAFIGQYFSDFRREVHVSKPFEIPKEWRRYRAFDYGLDRLACYWIAIDSARNCYVYKELCESDLPISTACERIIDMNGDDDIYITLAPPDMWSRSQETGRSKASLFNEYGVEVTKSSNNREAGWLALKELLKTDANGISRLVIFDNCVELIKCLPALQVDPKKPSDCATEPHDITHAPDALRYFAVFFAYPSEPEKPKEIRVRKDVYDDYLAASPSEREMIEKTYGGILVCNEY